MTLHARTWGKTAFFAGSMGLVALVACSHASTDSGPKMPIAVLQDPAQCAQCHAQHYQEWSGSMHAYSSVDPLFLAMQKRGQRETNGALGTFCVNCHAPIAVRENLTTDGSNLSTLDPTKLGVTCYFCHSVTAATDSHNNALTIASDGVMRADISDPQDNSFHNSAYSPLHDGEQLGASALCGTCHDVSTMGGVAIESSFAEWKQSLFAHDVPGQKLTCQGCHMPGSDGTAANSPGAPPRHVHDHSVPAVDLATTNFPDSDNQKTLVQANLDPSLVVKMCVRPPQSGDVLEVTLDNAFVGHNFPSGAAHDRRVWLEVVAYQGATQIFQSGLITDGAPLPTTDPNLWLFDEQLTGSDGKPVLFMWEATATALTALPYAVTSDPNNPAYYHAKIRDYPVPATADKITMRVRMTPFASEVLTALVSSGDLDPAIAAKVPTYTLAGSDLTWTKDKGFVCLP